MSQGAFFPQIRTVGLDGLLVTFGETFSDAANRAAIGFRTHIRALNWPEILESNNTLVSAFFRVDLVEHAPDALTERLQAQMASRDWLSEPLPAGRKRWTIPATLSGPQLGELLDLSDMTAEQARADLQAGLRVLMLGFAPGQPYLGQLGGDWDLPRQTNLTGQVPAGSIVAAVRQLCLFSNAAPTGWRHVGQTAFRCFRPQSIAPFPLSPGDEIFFQEVSDRELARIEDTHPGGEGGAVCEVLT